MAGPPAFFTATTRSLVGTDLGGVIRATDFACVTGALDALDLLLGATGPADRLALGQEEVTAVAVLDLDDVAGDADLVNGAGENELHDALPNQRAVEA